MTKKSVEARRRRDQERREKKAKKVGPPVPLRVRLVNWLDRLGAWLARRSRFVRILITALIAIILAAAFGLVAFEAVFPTTYEAPTSTQDSITQNFTMTMVALVVVGLVFYWIGWRVLVGFDFGETPLKPGRAAAVWVCFGILTLLGIFVVASIGLLQAVAPN
jgi:hypothetical protein